MTSPSHAAPDFFGLDLNCAIYHCAKKVQAATPYTPAKKLQWEADLIVAVIAYIKMMNNLVKPTKTLYIAVDGVAPMAKIKQQRLRRFRSAVQAQEEAEIKAQALGHAYIQEPRWDTTAITPGTQFMKALSTGLRAYAKANPNVVVSPADEPGEGEQKIMDYIRANTPQTAVIYGLDADLIVLSLWANATQGTELALFREEMEFTGGVKTNAIGEEQFLFLLTDKLSDTLYDKYGKPGQLRSDFLHDFVGLMNLLGNDFVPHGMALKIKESGVETLLRLMSTLPANQRLIQLNNKEWEYNITTLTTLFETLAQTEEQQILKMTSKKLNSRVGMTASKDPVDQAMARYNDQPIIWAAEKVFVTQIQLEDNTKPSWILKDDWKQIYDKEALFGCSPTTAANLYLDSLAWTLGYYSGLSVDLYFYYPWYLPPRFETITEVLKTRSVLAAPQTKRTPLKPLEQLAMVLPETSFHLLPPEFLKLPTMYPHAFPTEWPLFSLGRRLIWEAEPCIPLIQPDQIKLWIETMYDQ